MTAPSGDEGGRAFITEQCPRCKTKYLDVNPHYGRCRGCDAPLGNKEPGYQKVMTELSEEIAKESSNAS